MKSCLSKSPIPTSTTTSSTHQHSLRRSSTDLSIQTHRVANTKPSSTLDPISIQMLQAYLQELCSHVSSSSLSESSLSQLPKIRNLLNDSMALSQISLEFYCQFDSCLNLLSQITSSQNWTLAQDLMMLVGKLTKMIALQDYRPKKVSIPLRARRGCTLEEKASDLQIKIGRITPRLVNVKFI